MKHLTTISLMFAFTFIFGLCQVQSQVFFTEDFESGMPVLWLTSNLSPSVGWQVGDATNLSSTYWTIPEHGNFAASNDDAFDDATGTLNLAAEDYLLSAALALTGPGDFQLTFDAFFNGSYGSTAHVLIYQYSIPLITEVFTLTPAADWQEVSFTLDPSLLTTNLRIVFHHNDNAGWGSGFAIDDVVVEYFPQIDLAVTDFDMPDVVVAGSYPIQGTVENLGDAFVTDLDINFSIDGFLEDVTPVSGLSLNTGDTYDFTLSATWTANPSDEPYVLKLWASNINGGIDDVPSNDTLTRAVSVWNAIPPKNVLIEQFTGSWCQFCPDGDIRLDSALFKYPNAIGVNIHNIDDLEIPDGVLIANTYSISYPTATIERVPYDGQYRVNRGAYEARTMQRSMVPVPATVSVDGSYSSSTRELEVNVTADVWGNATGDFRLNLYVIENGFSSTDPLYDQANFYDDDAGHPFYGAGNPISGYTYNHLLRTMAGGPWGIAGVMPAYIHEGETYSHTFLLTIPEEWDAENLEVIGIVQRYGPDLEDREILNSITCAMDPGCTIDFRDCAGNLVISGITSSPSPGGTNVSLDWDDVPNGWAYQVRGRRAGTLPFGSTVKFNSYANIGGLIPGECYEWKVRGACSMDQIGPFSPLQTFCTPVPKLDREFGDAELYPNPVYGQADLTIYGERDDDIQVIITDISGREVFRQNVLVAKGPNTLSLDLTDLENGSYHLEIKGIRTIKFMVLR